MKKGTQIIYVPSHISFKRVVPEIPEHIPEEQVGRYLREKKDYILLHPNVLHIDCDMGFVMSVKGDIAFCRYWNKRDPSLLRTTSCSEGTPVDRLIIMDTRPQKEIDDCIKHIEKE